MITLETGAPGAGKTLYCVGKLLQPLVGATVKHENENGEIVEVPRTIYTNINGLLLEHEKIGPKELDNWHEWAKPGAVIVYDEVQKPWPLAPAGSKVPPCIQALETHRHMGVDFIILTQHPMLIHANVVRLVGRHLHVRRMGNMGLAVVYEWDTCSKTLLYKNALSKGPFKYDKKIFELYKSAELHTKQPRRLPTLVYGFALGLALLAYLGPTAYARMSERINPKPVTASTAATVPGVQTKIEGGQLVTTTTTTSQATPPASPVSVAMALAPVEIAGCVASEKRCTCYDQNAKKIEVELGVCVDKLGRSATPKTIPNFTDDAPAMARPSDGEILATMLKTKPPPMALLGNN